MLVQDAAVLVRRPWLLGLVLLCAGLGPGSRPALGQGACAPRAELVRWLADRHGETPIAIGLTDDGQMVEVYASEHRMTWSIVTTRPDGSSCFLTTGQSWQELGKNGVAGLGSD